MVFIACLVIFVYGMLSSLLGTIVPGLADKLHLTNYDVGYLALAQGAGLAAMSVIAGAFMDRKGKKIGVITGLTVTLGGLLLLAYSGSFIFAVASMLILGCGGSLVIVAANVIASDVSDNKRAATLNFLNVFSGLGGLATPLIAGNLLGANPSVTALYGAVATLFILCLALIMPMRRSKERAAPVESETDSVFRHVTLYILSAITLLYTACEFGIWNWLPKFLIASGMPRTSALTILSLGFACGLLFGRVAASTILWRISPFTVTAVSALGMLVTTLFVLRPMSPTMTAVVVFLAGLAMAPVFPTTIAIVGKLFRSQSATAIGFAITCGFSGLMLSSPVIGWLSGPEPSGLRRGLMLIPVLSLTIFLILIVSHRLLHGIRDRQAAIASPVA